MSWIREFEEFLRKHRLLLEGQDRTAFMQRLQRSLQEIRDLHEKLAELDIRRSMELQELRQELQELTEEKFSLLRENEVLLQELYLREQELQGLKKELSLQRLQGSALREELAQGLSLMKRLKEELLGHGQQHLKEENASLRAALARAQAERDSILRQAEAQRQRLSAQLKAETEALLKRHQQQIEDLRHRHESETHSRSRELSTLREQNLQLGRRSQELEAENRRLREELKRLQSQNEELQRQRLEPAQGSQAATEQLQGLKAEAEELKRNTPSLKLRHSLPLGLLLMLLAALFLSPARLSPPAPEAPRASWLSRPLSLSAQGLGIHLGPTGQGRYRLSITAPAGGCIPPGLGLLLARGPAWKPLQGPEKRIYKDQCLLLLRIDFRATDPSALLIAGLKDAPLIIK
mgnify:CR=1 FL=1|jgi:hypothetical protein